jgi:hypothetical protein
VTEDKFEFVIRTVGERTEKVCIELLNRQKSIDEQLHIVNQDSHAKAVDKTLRIGQASNAKWVVAIDADMLLIPGALAAVKAEVSTCGEDTAIIHPAVVDKLYRMRRWGLTLYRQSIIEELYDIFSEIRKKENLKIEGAAIKELTKKGNRGVVFSRNVAAIHDFYQYYGDLYRKAYLNTIRNPGYNRGLGNFWKKLAESDNDYLIMYRAMQDALNQDRLLKNSVHDFEHVELNRILQDLKLEEKTPLLWEEFIDQCLATTILQEIESIDKNKIFSDFYENNSIYQKSRSYLYEMKCRLTNRKSN